jgi:hypothetical protein
MPLLNRVTLMKIHMLLAAFIFPVALMFLITGGLYTWGVKGAYVSDVYMIELAQPLTQDQPELQALVERELRERSIDFPSGAAKVKKGGTSFQLEWTGSARDVVLAPTPDGTMAELTIKETTWYRHLVQLHKAKGGQLFKIYAAILAVSLFTILLSGFVMAWQIPKYRRLALVFSILGICMFLLMVTGS